MNYLELYTKISDNKLTRKHRFDLLCGTFNDWKKHQDFYNINSFLDLPIFDDLSFNIGVLTYSIGINSQQREMFYNKVYKQAEKTKDLDYLTRLFSGLESNKSDRYWYI